MLLRCPVVQALDIAAVALGFPLVCWFVGWFFLGRLGGLSPAERFAASFGVAFAALAGAAFLGFLIGAPRPLFHGGILALLLLAALVLYLRRPRATDAPDPALRWLVAASALTYLHLLLVQLLLPQYVGADWFGDWRMHYEASRIFVGDLDVDTQWAGTGTYTLASRTPLFNLTAAFVMGLAGHDFYVYQLAAVLLNCCFVAAVYLVLDDLFGARAARLGLVLAPLNLWLLHMAWFTWPKMLAAYFIVMGLHFYLQALSLRATEPRAALRLFGYCWVFSLLGYLTHQVAAVYLTVLVLHALTVVLRNRACRPGLANLAFLAGSMLLLLGPWYGWILIHFGVAGTVGSTPLTQMDADARPDVWYYLDSLQHNLHVSVVPRELLKTLDNGPLTFDELYRRATEFYFCLLTGALTVSLTGFVAVYVLCLLGWAAWRRDILRNVRWPEWLAFAGCTLLGGIGATLLHPLRTPNGVAHAASFVTTLLLCAFGWGLLSRVRWWLAAPVCLGMVAEFAVMFWSHVHFVAVQPRLLDPYGEIGLNPRLKAEQGLVFLNDCLGPSGEWAATVATALVQMAFVALLVWWLAGQRRPAALSDGSRAPLSEVAWQR